MSECFEFRTLPPAPQHEGPPPSVSGAGGVAGYDVLLACYNCLPITAASSPTSSPAALRPIPWCSCFAAAAAAAVVVEGGIDTRVCSFAAVCCCF